MSISIKEAFMSRGIRAEFEGKPATIVPVTAETVGDFDQSEFKRGVAAGQLLLSWNDGAKRNGKIIDADARSDLTFLVGRGDGTDLRVPATRMTDAVLFLLRAERDARENAAAVDRANEEAREIHRAAIDRGERSEEPEIRQPEFPADAFDRIGDLVSCVKESQLAIKADVIADIDAKASADAFTAKLREATRDPLNASERAKAEEAMALKAEIAMLNADHPDAAEAVMPIAYEGDGEAAREVMAGLPDDPDDISAARISAMAANPDMDLARRLFSVATTTPTMEIECRALSHAGFRTCAQELSKDENREASDAILPRMAAVTGDAMESYKWQGKIYTKDGADILLMRDEYAAFAYAWDSASRVGEIDPRETVLRTFGRDDVPSEGRLEHLRSTLAGLRHDNGAEINFDWEDAPEEGAAFEA